MASGTGATPDEQPRLVAICSDFIWLTKLGGAAGILGFRMEMIPSLHIAGTSLSFFRPRAVFVDLVLVPEPTAEMLASWRGHVDPGVKFMAFGPHVDRTAMQAAEAAGFDFVLPRGKLSIDLRGWMTKCIEP
jgi:hypothetical protein